MKMTDEDVYVDGLILRTSLFYPLARDLKLIWAVNSRVTAWTYVVLMPLISPLGSRKQFNILLENA